MDIWDEIKKLTGYQSGNGGVDSYGVDHSGFSTRDELEYQSARLARENQLAEGFAKQGIAEENYPQYGTNFWGGSPENNYGFGTSNIKQNIENVTSQLNNSGFNNGANNGQITTNSDYTVNTESLVGKPSSYFQSNNTYSSATGRAIENVAGAVTAPNTTSYVTQNAYTPSPTYGASKATGYQIQTPSAFASQPTNQSANIAPNTTSSPIMEPINRYLASVSPQYTAPTSLGQTPQPQRTVYQSLSGFAQNNEKWYENNPQKDSFNYVRDEYETNKLVNDCLKSDRFRQLMDYLYQPGVEGRGYEDNLNKIDQPTHSGLSEGLYNDVRKNIPQIAKYYPKKLENLTQEQVENIMCQSIYKPQHVETINNDKFAKTYWDLVVNHNPNKTSVPWIQQSVNEITDENIKVDGTMGTSSIIAINNMDEEQLKLLNNSINDKRRRYFEEQNSPRFKRGLLNRNKRLRW